MLGSMKPKYRWAVSLAEGSKERVIEVTAIDALSAAMQAATSLAKGERITSLVERGQAVTTENRVLPVIYGWADRTNDPLRPGFMGHAIAADGTVVAHRVIHSSTLDHARTEMEGLSAAYLEQYPSGYQFVWVADPDADYNLIRARLYEERLWSFDQVHPNHVRMRCARSKAVAGYISMLPAVPGAFYAVPVPGMPEEGDLLPDPPYPSRAAAARALHVRFLAACA
jgi:hypothetical protein